MAYENPTAGAAWEGLNAAALSVVDLAELNTLSAAIPTAAVANITSTNLTAITPGANLTAITPGTNLTAVPGTFADEAAVATYLVTVRAEIETRFDALDTSSALIISEVETRLDAIDTATALIISQSETRLDALEAKVNDLLAKLRLGGLVTA